MSYWSPVLIFLLIPYPALVQERLNEKQMLFILELKGDWGVENAYTGTAELKQKLDLTVRFTKKGMYLLDSVNDKRLWRYTKISPTHRRVDMRLERDGKTHVYSLIKEGARIKLVTKANGNSTPPSEVKKKPGNLCIILAKKAEEEIGD